MATEDLAAEAGKALQTEMEGMPAKSIKVSFHGMKTTIEGKLAEEIKEAMDNDDALGLEFTVSASGYVKHSGKTWLEGESGKRPEITIAVTDVKVKKK